MSGLGIGTSLPTRFKAERDYLNRKLQSSVQVSRSLLLRFPHHSRDGVESGQVIVKNHPILEKKFKITWRPLAKTFQKYLKN